MPSLGTHASFQRAPEEGMHCKCSPDAAERWLEKLSFPLLEFCGGQKMALAQREAETKSVCSKEETNQADGVLCKSAGLH